MPPHSVLLSFFPTTEDSFQISELFSQVKLGVKVGRNGVINWNSCFPPILGTDVVVLTLVASLLTSAGNYSFKKGLCETASVCCCL